MGISWCRDEGVRLAETPYIGIFNARMRFTDGWLDKVLWHLARNKQTLFCTTSVVLWQDIPKNVFEEIDYLKKKKDKTEKEKELLKDTLKSIEDWEKKKPELGVLDEINDKKERRYGADIVEFTEGDLIINPI